MRNKEKCLHSLDDQDIKTDRSSIKLVLSHTYAVRGVSHIIEIHYCPICSCHWENGTKYDAADWINKKF